MPRQKTAAPLQRHVRVNCNARSRCASLAAAPKGLATRSGRRGPCHSREGSGVRPWRRATRVLSKGRPRRLLVPVCRCERKRRSQRRGADGRRPNTAFGGALAWKQVCSSFFVGPSLHGVMAAAAEPCSACPSCEPSWLRQGWSCVCGEVRDSCGCGSCRAEWFWRGWVCPASWRWWPDTSSTDVCFRCLAPGPFSDRWSSVRGYSVVCPHCGSVQ